MKKKLCLGLLAVASGAYLVRRLGLRWGATDAEVYRPLPGDEVVPHPMLETTHAITIHAPRAAIWPWLVQMGYQRAGWYTDSWYQLVDRYLFREKRPPSADQILPADFFVARLMLRTIKQRVEGRRRQAPERVEGTTPHQVRQDESLV
jgi:hypothetical protein